MLGRNEDALIAALRAHRDCARLVRTIGSLPKLVEDKLLQQYVTDAPALYVIPQPFQVTDGMLYLRFAVACVARNVAGHEAGRKGDGIDLGADHLMVLATRALNEQRIGDASWFLRRGELVDDEIFFAAGLTAIELQFESSAVELDPDWAAGELDDFLRFHADIDIEPHAGAEEHAKWLKEPVPDYSSSAPDAQADVQLPGASA